MTDVHIRRCRPDDVDPLFEAAQESIADISPWMSWCNDDYSRDDAQKWIDTRQRAWEKNESYDFAVEDDGDRFLGVVGVNAIDPFAQRANMGYWIRTSAAGRGITTKAGKLLIEFAFTETPLCRLEIVVALDNHASHRVAIKLGGVREGVLRERLRPQGVPQDAVMYSILRSDRELS